MKQKLQQREREKEGSKIIIMEMGFLRMIFNKMKRNKIRNEVIREHFNIVSVATNIQEEHIEMIGAHPDNGSRNINKEQHRTMMYDTRWWSREWNEDSKMWKSI